MPEKPESKPRWTPGPWRLGPINYADVYGPNGEIVALMPKGYPTTVADAQLIAAAPDLYAALAIILDCVDYTSDSCRPNECVAAVLPLDVIRLCRLALARPVR